MRKEEFRNELFGDELLVLKDAAAFIEKDTAGTGSDILERYKVLLKEYEKLLKLTYKTFSISDVQGKELKRRETEVKTLLDNSNQGFLTFGSDLLVNREYSSECIKIFDGKIANMNILELLSGKNDAQNELFADTFREVFETGDERLQEECLRRLPGMLSIKNNYIDVKYRVIRHDDYNSKSDRIMLVLTDVTEIRKSEDQIIYLSYHDKLTSLYNRAYIDNVMPQLQTEHNMPLSIIIADMNGLKLTNDVFGHENGDRLLINAAGVLQSCCRKSDIVARWGGDEFLIILPSTDSEECQKVCARIKEACLKTESDPIELSISIGAATMDNPNTSIIELFNIAENIMYGTKMAENRKTRRRVLLSLEKELHTKCFEEPGHVERVKCMAAAFGKLLKLEADSTDFINMGLLASLHDIGKIAVPKEILGKKGPLTASEWDIMKSHTEVGFRMAQSIEEPVLAQAILAFREHWDGKGYPYGLKGEQIPLIARILSIIDAFDVMTHERPYKKALGEETALAELDRCGGIQFDPVLTELFVKNYKCMKLTAQT